MGPISLEKGFPVCLRKLRIGCLDSQFGRWLSTSCTGSCSILMHHPVALTLHFTLHGVHHYLPMDKLRLVMPPALFLILATPFWKLAHAVFFYNWHAATAVFCGGIFGYICYDMTHYFLHHRTLPSYMRKLKKHHLQHHFMDYQNGFGVTSWFWDVVFGTELVPPPMKTLKTL
ncbi:hypothetical protein DH86_00001714 [Scytalidium sp. 3C]|nr:hypothetical protein DH86_00001714 [Scytalidium sp. 3C]